MTKARFTEATIKTTTITAKYRGKSFFIDVVENMGFDAWIYTSDMGVKMLMFGTGCSREKFMELVEANFEEYADMYVKRYH